MTVRRLMDANKTTVVVEREPQKPKAPPLPPPAKARTGPPPHPFGCPRDFLNNHFVYVTVSPRARGLSIGVTMNPDKHCNFDCVYCEVDRCLPGPREPLDVHVMAQELQKTIDY